jgi:hypothetical protein
MMLSVTMGLPGAGKTAWSSSMQSNSYRKGRRTSVIDFDSCTLRQVPEKHIKSHLQESLRSSLNERVVVDGMFLTSEDVIKLLAFLEPRDLISLEELTIEWWNPNVEACLHNDRGRREKDSSITIQNAVMERVDAGFIALLETAYPSLKSKIKGNMHNTSRKPDWKVLADEQGVYYDQEGTVKSGSWCLGGSWADCWGNHGTVAAEAPPENFRELDEILEKIAPHITFLQYKSIYGAVVKTDEYGEGDYYGGSTSHAYRYFSMSNLYDELDKRDLITQKDNS